MFDLMFRWFLIPPPKFGFLLIASREDIQLRAPTPLGIAVLTDAHWSSTEADVRFSLHRAKIRNVPQQEGEGVRRGTRSRRRLAVVCGLQVVCHAAQPSDRHTVAQPLVEA